MARAKGAPKRTSTPDPVYGSVKVTKLVNRVMRDGKKSVAMKQVYGAFDIIKSKTNTNPLDVFEQVLKTVSPVMEVRSRRVGGAAYQVPTPVRGPRAFALAVRWIVEEAKKRPSSTFHTYSEKLAAEMLDALKNEGGAIAKRNTVHKMAEANKAFAHFRW